MRLTPNPQARSQVITDYRAISMAGIPAEHFLRLGLSIRHRAGPSAPGVRIDDVAIGAEFSQPRGVLRGEHLAGKRRQVLTSAAVMPIALPTRVP